MFVRLILLGIIVFIIYYAFHMAKTKILASKQQTQQPAYQLTPLPPLNSQPARTAFEAKLRSQVMDDFARIGWDLWDSSVHDVPGQFDRMQRASTSRTMMLHNFDLTSSKIRVIGESGTVYEIREQGCSCPDFWSRHLPCKHMYFVVLNQDKLPPQCIIPPYPKQGHPTKASDNTLPSNARYYNIGSTICHKSSTCEDFTLLNKWDAVPPDEALRMGMSFCNICEDTNVFIYGQSKVYHKTKSCSSAKSIPSQLKESEVIKQGATKCSRCWK